MQKFAGDGNGNFASKKRVAPRPPTDNDDMPSWVRKGPAPPIPSPSRRKADPIREMESIGKRSVDYVSGSGCRF